MGKEVGDAQRKTTTFAPQVSWSFLSQFKNINWSEQTSTNNIRIGLVVRITRFQNSCSARFVPGRPGFDSPMRNLQFHFCDFIRRRKGSCYACHITQDIQRDRLAFWIVVKNAGLFYPYIPQPPKLQQKLEILSHTP